MGLGRVRVRDGVGISFRVRGRFSVRATVGKVLLVTVQISSNKSFALASGGKKTKDVNFFVKGFF